MKFSFIRDHSNAFPVAALCRVLGVSRQGFYAFRARSRSPRIERDQALRARVRAAFLASRGRYGSPRIRQQLRREGLRVGKRRVERLMREEQLRARKPARFRKTTQVLPNEKAAPNLLNRDFSAKRPNERWVADLTYVWIGTRWSYLAVVIDLYSRAVVGWSLDTSLHTALPIAALEMALRRRKPGNEAKLVSHTDRGCQYTSSEYQERLRNAGIRVSMSRRGNCWDNAVAESFFATIKQELVHTRPWTSLEELSSALFEYIEVFYNRQRLHSSLNYRTPAEADQAFLLAA